MISLKSPKFEDSRNVKPPFMKRFTSTLKAALLAVGALFYGASDVQAQCTITYDGSPCVGTPIRFFGANSGTTHDWDFNGENSQSGQKNVNYAFKSAGTKQIKYITTVNGTKCTSTVNLVIRESPKIKLSLVNLYEQCFEKNLFCFNDSTFNSNGAKIKNIKYLVSDGQLFEYSNPSMPQTFCFSIKDQRGGTFDLYIEVEDENGCVSADTIQAAVKVREKIGARFTSNKPVQCDSVTAVIKNISQIDKSQVKNITWYWGDGSITNDWGPDITKTFYGQGTYNSKMVIETIDGCKDSFEVTATATVFASKANIVADKDSTCISDPKIAFKVDQIPSGATGLLWNFGDPNTGPRNFDNRNWATEHVFSGLGPFQINLTYKHPICGNKSAFDTVIILGPVSTIEVAFNRIAEFEVFQCPKDIMDTVHFKNFSTFYHNDKDFTDDDSTWYKPDGTLGHTFRTQVWVKPIRNELNSDSSYSVYQGNPSPGGGNDYKKRERVCAIRLWDFGDNYAPKCTTDVMENKNVFVNCNFSRDTLPKHYYPSWDLVMLSDFKNAPMQDAIFIDSNGLCKILNVWPDSMFYIIQDSIVTVPNDPGYLNLAASDYGPGSVKKYLQDIYWKGKGTRYIEDPVEMELGNGDTAYVGPMNGPYNTMHIGPKTVKLNAKEEVQLRSKTDSVKFLLTVTLKKDTLPYNLYLIRYNKGERPIILDSFKRFPNGKENFDWSINYQRYRDLYYAKIPQCQNVKLLHKDTCHPFQCESEATKQLAMLHANAGGVGSGLLKDAIECLGAKSPQYGITFVLSDLKPGCTFSHVAINFDSTCNPNGFVPLSGLSPGGRPPGPPFPGYQIAGNPPSRYSKQYTASEVCDPSGCITVGIIVGNGVDKNGNKPLCSDTQWYSRFACFPLIDPAFEVVTPKPNALNVRKICKGDDIVVRPTPGNKTRTRDLKSLRWELATGNASPYYSKGWRRYIQEDYFHYQKLPGRNDSAIYNYIVVTRGGEDPYQIPCTDVWDDGKTYKIEGPDTIITAEITKYEIAADVSEVWDNIKDRAEKRGFDPFALSPTDIAKMIWNNVGVIGQPSTGAYGCIDTTGFGKFIKYYFVPDPDYTTILSPRDTNIVPLDSWKQGNSYIKAYTFNPNWAGYHLISLSMTSANGKCDDFAAFPVLVGFAMELELPDSIICQDQANNLQALPKYRMFHPDPINFGTWDTYDYWRDQDRQKDIAQGKANREAITRWDWSKADDGVSTPFGGAPYGAAGPGTLTNPWKQLGGGGAVALYYKNDSGVYIMRNVAGDSTGCMDTIERRLFITRLDPFFNLSLNIPSCNSVIEFFDSSILYDPCNWAIKNCDGTTNPIECDFIREWFIDWGDGITNLYKRSSSDEQGLPDRIAHKFTRNGWFHVKYLLKTDQGCEDTVSRWIKIPGPRPKFEFTTKFGNEVTICAGDSIQFTNLTDSASTSADWTWFFGDGAIDNVKDQFVSHTYDNAGRFFVFLEQYDSLIVPPNVRKFCPATYPDTPSQAAFIVNVLPRDSVRGLILKPAICPGDSNTFIDLSDTLFKSYKWRFENQSTGQVDTITVTDSIYTRIFWTPGVYKVTHMAEYDPTRPNPWCPTLMADLFFTVDSVIADFTIDSSGKPDFSFTRTDINGTQWRWGFGHQNDITQTLPNVFIENLKSGDKTVQWSYDSSNVYYVCLEVTNATGCKDTICKPVVVDLFVYLANVFTPGDNNGKNDTYRVPIQGQDLFEIRIFNRWGERVFYSEDPKVQWNGRVNNDGPEVPSGTYFYQVTYRFKGKDKINKVNGSVNLIRGN